MTHKTVPVDQRDTPRVEACIDAAMARNPGRSKIDQARYFEDVHQDVAPLARQLERELAAQQAEIERLRKALNGVVNAYAAYRGKGVDFVTYFLHCDLAEPKHDTANCPVPLAQRVIAESEK
jgi:hypothetical protein